MNLKYLTSEFSATLDHIGIAVNDLDLAISFYEEMGLKMAGREVIYEQGVEVALFPAGESRIELLSPIKENSPISRFIRRNGAGMHHLALKVNDLVQALEQCKAKGIGLIDAEPKIGAEGKLIAFIHPRSSKGVLIELTQDASANKGA